MNKTMTLIFTSFRDGMTEDGLKVSIDKHTPRLCSYPMLTYLVIPTASKNLTRDTMERICVSVLDNNWELIQNFITEVYDLGIRRLVFCDWATEEQIANGKLCLATTIGDYIWDKRKEFVFPIELEYKDGRSALE